MRAADVKDRASHVPQGGQFLPTERSALAARDAAAEAQAL
jgi:hypothetical protein